MDFVLGPEPKNWTTGPPPPSPASEFSQYTDPSTIIKPGAVPMVSNPATLAKQKAHRRRVLRDVALGIIGFVILVLLVFAGWSWWYWTRRAKRTTTGEQNMDQEKGSKGLTKSLAMRRGLYNVFSGYQVRLRKIFREKTPATGEVEEDRPKSAEHRISGETFVDADGDSQVSEKKELRVSVLEVFHVEPEPTEPWTPRGTNRRTHDIPEVNPNS